MSNAPSTVIYVDIDDTLVRSFGSKRIPMTDMVALIPKLKEHGATLFCWSSGGSAYAQRSAAELGIAECFTAFLPKPQMLIDDVSIHDWKLTELHPNECRSMTPAELLDRRSPAGPSA
jgi:phosphoserine phosphatase